MNLATIIDYTMFFFLGALCALLLSFLSFYSISGLEIPFIANLSPVNDTPAPSDFISENNIKVYSDKIVIEVENASLSKYAPTGSMKPLFDHSSNGIRIKPVSEDDINIGDIITFKEGNLLIIHRVIEKGIDNNGVYFITKEIIILLVMERYDLKTLNIKLLG